MLISPDERAARAAAVEALRDAFLAYRGIDRDTAHGLVVCVLFEEAIRHYRGARADAVRGYERPDLLRRVKAAAADTARSANDAPRDPLRTIPVPKNEKSLNTMIWRFQNELTEFLLTNPALPLIRAVAGPTSSGGGFKRGRTFLRIDFTDPPATPRRLPRRGPALVGRDDEQAHVRALLTTPAPPAFVVLHGPPGIGRSALALQVAHDLLDAGAFADAVRYAFEPPDVPTSHDVLAAIFGIAGSERRTTAASELTALYLRELARQRTIVLLDDLPDGWPVEQLRPPAGSVVLVTAQHAIRLPDAVNVALPPLAEEDAVRMLLALDDRLQLENPEYEQAWRRWTLVGRRGPGPHPTAAAELAALCGYVPGELRAAVTFLREQPSDLGVSVFLQWYKDSLTGGPELRSSATTERVETIAAPYARLPEEERRAFRALAAFGGTFSLDDARAVADDPEGIAVAQLARTGFLSYDEAAGRYIVPVPLRLFGHRLLRQEPDRARVLRRMATQIAAAGAEAVGAGGLRLDRAPPDVLATFVAAQRAAEEFGDASLVARFGELAACANPPADIAEPWLDAGAVAARTRGDPAQILRIAVARVGQYRNFALERTLAAAEEALGAVPAAACEGADLLGERRVAVAQMALRAAKALGRARTVLALATEVRSTNGFANAADHHTFPVLVAEAHADLGQIADALKWAGYAVREARDFPHTIYRANALNVQGAVLLAAGKRADAKRAFDATLALYPEAFDAEGGAYRAPRVAVSGQPNLDLALRDAYADEAKLHPGLVAYALRTEFVEDAGEATRRCTVVAEGIVAVRAFMPAFYVAFGTVLLALARRTHARAHAAHAFYWLTCAIGLFTPRGMDDLLRSDGVDIRTLPFESMEADASAALITALTSTLFACLQDLRAVGNAYYHRGEALLLLDDPRAAADDFEAAGDLLATIESPLLPRIKERSRVLRRVRR